MFGRMLVRGQPHRLARVNYPPRVFGFGASFVAALLLSYERDLAGWVIPIGALILLVYPHLAYLRACMAQDSKEVERENLLADAFLLGFWSATLGFHVWISFSLFVSSLLNNAVNWGGPGLVRAGLAFILGAAIFCGGSWLVVGTIPLHLGSSWWVNTYVVLVTTMYLFGIGLTFHDQNRKLAAAHGEIEQKNRVFRSLLDMGIVTFQAPDLGGLLDRSLDQFRRLYPDKQFGIVLLDPERSDVVRYASFHGLNADEQTDILARLRSSDLSDETFRILETTDDGEALCLFSMKRHLTLCEGFLLVKTRDTSARFLDVMRLFLDQLAAALENKLLTLKLKHTAETDAITNIYNRAYLDQALAQAVENKKTHESLDFAVVLVDLIGLKRVNDSLGHRAGDAVIRSAAECLRRVYRDSDVLARYGGDEFVVLCHGGGIRAGEHVRDRIRGHCDGKRTTLKDVQGESVTVELALSIGTAGSDEAPPERILELADERMYADKARWYAARAPET